MMGNAVVDSKTFCYLCHKLQTVKHQDLVCDSCIHNKIELIRKSIIENEAVSSELRCEINGIFEACDGSTLTSSELPAETNLKAATCLKTSGGVVKSLSLQLRRLDILNANIKFQGIEKSQKALRDKVAAAKAKLQTDKTGVQEREQLIEKKRHLLIERHETEQSRKRLEVARLRGENITQITRQATLLQFSHYLVMREVIFDSTDLSRVGSRFLKDPLSFYGQPVIPISSFLSNNKIDVINTFLENLIRLQLLLRDLLFDGELELFPYLSHLETLLPDEKFYDSVQDKIDAIRNENNSTEIENAAYKEPADKSPPLLENSITLDKIVIHNKSIQIPISSRTANINRRASVKESSTDTKVGKGVVAKYTPTVTKNVQRTSGVLEVKKIVIVPHKILTRPFTRLKPREYLKFVLIVVKILLTFNAMLREIDNKMPIKKLRHSRSMIDTLNNLRSKLKVNPGTEEFLYDIEKILLRVANLDEHFRIGGLYAADSQRVSQRNSASSSAADFSLVLSTTSSSSMSASVVNIHSSATSSQAGPSNMNRLYDAFKARRNDSKVQPVSVDVSSNYASVYGMISEPHLSEASGLSLPSTSGKIMQLLSQPQRVNYDLKAIMKVVHSLIAEGDSASFSSDPSKKFTLSMKEQSWAQLEEWDVVSQMY